MSWPVRPPNLLERTSPWGDAVFCSSGAAMSFDSSGACHFNREPVMHGRQKADGSKPKPTTRSAEYEKDTDTRRDRTQMETHTIA